MRHLIRKEIFRRVLSLSLLLTSNVLLYQNCAPFKAKLGAQDLGSLGNGTLSAERFTNAKAVINQNCTTCHSAGKVAGLFPLTFATEAEFVSSGMVVPGDIDNSKLVYRMTLYGGANGRTSDMPQGGSISKADYDTIVNWVSLMGVPDQPAVAGGQQFMCKTGTDVPVADLKPLLKTEYRNTLIDLLSPLSAADQTAMVADLDSYLIAWPDDQGVPFSRLSKSLTPAHVAAQWKVANRFGELIDSSYARLVALGGSCFGGTTPPDSCIDAFIDAFGLKTFRRPLTFDEHAAFMTFYKSRTVTPKQDLIALFLLSPEFLYHLENQGALVGGRTDLLRLTPYEIASKISYQYWQSMPNTELFDAAASGQLGTSDGIKNVLDQVIFGTQKARTKAVIDSYFNEWLKIDKMSPLTNQAADFLAFTAGENLNQPGYYHRADMINEVMDLIDYHVWDKPGTFNDVLTSDISFAKTDALAHIYGVPKYTPGGPLVRFPAGERSGLLTRAAMLVTGGVETNPIYAGVNTTRNILCNNLPSPSANVVLMRPAPIPAGTLMTTEDKVTHMTSGTVCTSCHSVINPIGFTFEAYDAFGRTRKTLRQDIYDTNGNVIGSLPVNPAGDVVITPGKTAHVANAVEFSQKIAESKQAEACFTRNYYRYTFRKMEDDVADGCGMQAMFNRLEDPAAGGMIGMFKEAAVQPAFLLRRLNQ